MHLFPGASVCASLVYCIFLNFLEPFIMRVSRGSLESQTIMLAYKNRMPDVTLAKFNDRQRHMYPNLELKGSRKLRNLQYLGTIASHS